MSSIQRDNDADNWRYSAINVTKYNPVFRDKQGRYTKDEWTDYSCVGMIINGEEVTYQEYELVENSYIQAVNLFLDYYGCTELMILHVEKYENEEFNERDLQYHNLWEKITDEYVIDKQELIDVLRLLLRSYIWGELFCVSNNNIAIRFGYDYYMSFNNGVGKLPDKLKSDIQSLGLFVEDD